MVNGPPQSGGRDLIFVIEPEHEAVAVHFEFGGNPCERKVGFRSHSPAVFKTAEQLLRQAHGDAAAHLIGRRPIRAVGAQNALIDVDHAEARADIGLHVPAVAGELVQPVQHHGCRGQAGAGAIATALGGGVGGEAFDFRPKAVAEIVAVRRPVTPPGLKALSLRRQRQSAQIKINCGWKREATLDGEIASGGLRKGGARKEGDGDAGEETSPHGFRPLTTAFYARGTNKKTREQETGLNRPAWDRRKKRKLFA